MQDCGTGILRLIKSRSCALCYLPICIFLHKLLLPLFFLSRLFWISQWPHPIFVFIFSQRAPLPRGRVTFSWVAEYIPTFTTIFHKYIRRFSGWAIFLSKDVGHNLKPINNLSFLSFLSLKSLWLSEKCLLRNEFV